MENLKKNLVKPKLEKKLPSPNFSDSDAFSILNRNTDKIRSMKQEKSNSLIEIQKRLNFIEKRILNSYQTLSTGDSSIFTSNQIQPIKEFVATQWIALSSFRNTLEFEQFRLNAQQGEMMEIRDSFRFCTLQMSQTDHDEWEILEQISEIDDEIHKRLEEIASLLHDWEYIRESLAILDQWLIRIQDDRKKHQRFVTCLNEKKSEY